MTLRGVLLAIAGLAVAGAAVATFAFPPAWPTLLYAGVFLVLLLFERARYGRAQAVAPPPAGWQRTGERFRDDADGGWVEVWFDPATGERRYVAASAP